MKDLNYVNSNKHLQNEFSYFNHGNSPNIENESIIIVEKRRFKNRKKRYVYKYAQPTVASYLSKNSQSKKPVLINKRSSMPELNNCTKSAQARNKSRHGMDKQKQNKGSPFQSNFIINAVSEHPFDKTLIPFRYPRQTNFKIYRCQIGSSDGNCCCSCNSDAMFEVMKSLYDCYKKKNCDNCNCILCGHLQKEDKLSEKKKGALIAASELMRKAKAEGLLTTLDGKTPEQREKILRGLAMKGIPLPEGKTPSQKKLIDKVRADLGVPPEPENKAIRDKHEKAAKAGKLQPLEGKTPAEKEKILKGLHDMGIPLPEGRTPSEKALIAKIKETPSAPSKAGSAVLAPSELMRRAKAEGLLTTLKGKTPDEREKILRGLAMKGLPLPEGQSPSEKKIINKVRTDLGVPIEPATKDIRDKHDKAAKVGLLLPLEGKTPKQKEKLLRGQHKMGIPLPIGRTPSEKSLIARVMAGSRPPSKAGSAVLAPSEQLRKAKAEGLLTTLDGKTPDQREKILRGLAMKGIPLPEGKTSSQKKLVDKVRADLGLPPEPKNKGVRDKHDKAAKAGLLYPLEGKTPKQKEKLLRGQHKMGIPLPVGRTPSEKSLIAKVMAGSLSPSKAGSAVLAPSEQLRKAKAEGLLTTLDGKTPDQREKILRGLAMKGIPLPEGKTPSQKKLVDKVRADLGLPPEPKNKAIRDKHEKAAAAGLLHPLEGKTPKQKEKLLRGQHKMGIPLPVGRTPSEKSLIAKVMAGSRPPSKAGSAVLAPSEQLRKAKAEGLLTTLDGKTPDQREKILRGLAMKGIPLPEGKTPSQKKLIDKVRADLGLPPEPKNKGVRDKHEKAAKAGKLQPLEGKTPAEKEKILKGLHNMGIPLPEGRTPSEKSLIAKIKASPRAPSKAASAVLAPSEQMRRAKAEGLLTPLAGKTPEQREKILRGLAMKGIPLPEGKTPSEKKLIDKVRTDLGVPVEPKTKDIRDKHEKAAKVGLLLPLEGKTPKQKEKLLQGQHNMGIPLPIGRTPSEKSLIARIMASPRAPSKAGSAVLAPSEQMRRAKAEGLLTPLEGKTPEQKEKILKGLAMKGLPLPEGKTPSDKKLIDKVRDDLGLPPEPKNKSIRDKHDKAAAAGLLQPLEGKTPAEKEKILKGLHNAGIPLPEGRTPSEKSLIAKVKASPRTPSKAASAVLAPSEQMRRAKAEGLLTPLDGKTPEQKEKILKGLAMKGLPLPEGKTPSQKKLVDKVRAEMGLPPEPKNKSIRDKHDKAAKAGLLQPLEGKTPAEKKKILKGLHDAGIPLPEGRTPSEKSLIAKIKASPRAPSKAASTVLAPSEQMRRAKAEGLLTPLAGKTPDQREKILRGLAMKGIPLPEAQTPSEKKLINKVRTDLGVPVEPKTKDIRDKHDKAAKVALLLPLEGKTPKQKEKLLQGQHNMGIPLPIGRTPSEKSLIARIMASPRAPSKAGSAVLAPSEQMRRAKAEGLLTPLDGKTPEQKEKILKGLAMKGLPLPEGKTPSDKKLIDKVRDDLGLPPEPKNKSIRDKHDKAAAAGLLQPLEGKTPAEKEKILKGLHNAGIPLPEGRTPSEKSLIAKIKASPRAPSKAASAIVAPSEQMRRAKAEGLLTPLAGKTPEQREKILRGLAMKGIPLPEGKTPSEKKLINKVRTDLGVPVEPKSKDIRDKHEKAAKVGLLLPLEGKTPKQKEKLLQGQHNMGIPLPVGRTPSEKSLIAKIMASPRAPSKAGSAVLAPSEQMRRAKAEGLLTTLKDKTPEQREKILRALAMRGIPLPEGQSPSEKKLIDKVRDDLGLPIEPKNKAIRDKHEKAAIAGLMLPLEGKTPKQKENILRGQHKMGIPLPVGRTPSEKSLIAKVMASSRPPSQAVSEILAPSEHMRRAKAEGLLTPLKGKTPEQKEKILKGLAMRGLPLPEGQSPSEKGLIDKVRADLGLPVEPKNKSIRDKHEKAAVAGLLLPLEGKTPKQKENILRGQHNMGIPLPEGRTPSEKSLIAKIKASPRGPSRPISGILAPSEQMRRAKAEGLLTPLDGKTPEQKEKILKGLAMKGLPLPEGKTPSQKKLIDKVRADLGLPPEPKNKSIRDKHDKAARAGLLQPLEGKTPAEKEKTLKGLHDLGIPLPEGRTPSEKSLIAKIKASPRAPSKAASAVLAPSEQMRRAKAEGLLTPLEGKTPDEREKILRGLAMKGIPLPEGKTPSEKKLIDKVRADLGLPPEPKNKAVRDKHEDAAKAGLLYPLEGKTPKQKEKLLRGQHKMDIPLPVGRTPSEKSLIAKIMAGPGAPSIGILEVATPSEQMRKAKAEGLLTPLKGKTPEEREKILRGLAMKGIPLPEGQTPSEKKLIDKVRADLGLPPEPKNKAIREKHEKAAAAGGLLPLEGKTPAEKEKILKALHGLGIPLPEGRTPSEKSLIAKVMASPRPPSKAGLLGKKVSVSASKKGVGIDAQEYEDVTKTTVCDRSCGCDKKKIRFKHSYVKIKVTSPDITSLCDCDYECIPGIKNGAFIDNEGIKVTVGTAVGSTSYTSTYDNYIKVQEVHGDENTEHKRFKYSTYRVSSLESGPFSNDANYTPKNSSSVESYSTRLPTSDSEDICLQNNTPPYEGRTRKSDRIVENFNRHRPLCDIYKNLTSKTRSAASSFDSIIVIKSEMSLCYTSTSNSRDTISLMSVADSSVTSSSAHYSGYQSSEDLSNTSLDGPTTSYDAIGHYDPVKKRKLPRNIRTVFPQPEFTVLRMSQIKLNFTNKKTTNEFPYTEAEDPVVLFNHLPSKLDVSKIIDKIKSNKRYLAASSIFIVIPASDDSAACSSVCDHSTYRIDSSDTHINILRDASEVVSTPAISTSSMTRHDAQVCGKGKKFYMKEVSSNDTESIFQNKPVEVFQHIDMTKDKFCQISEPGKRKQMVTLKKADESVGTDAVADRSCPENCSTCFVSSSSISEDHYSKKAVFRRNMVHFLPDKRSAWVSLPDMLLPSMVSLSNTKASINRCQISSLSLLLDTSVAPTVSSVLRHNIPSSSTLGDVGCKLFRQKTNRGCPFLNMRSISSESSVEARNKPTRLAFRDAGCTPHQVITPGCLHLPDMRTTPPSDSLILLRGKPSTPAPGHMDCTPTQGPYCRLQYTQMPTTDASVVSVNTATIPIPGGTSSMVLQRKRSDLPKKVKNSSYLKPQHKELTPSTETLARTHTPTHSPNNTPLENICCCKSTSSCLENKDGERTDDCQKSGEVFGCSCCELPVKPPPSTEPSEYTKPVSCTSVVPSNDYYDARRLLNSWQHWGEPFDWKYSDKRTPATGSSALTHVPTNSNNIPPEDPCCCENENNNNDDERTDVLQTSGERCTCCELSDRSSLSKDLSIYTNPILCPNGSLNDGYDAGHPENNGFKRNNNSQNKDERTPATGTPSLTHTPPSPSENRCCCESGYLETNDAERTDAIVSSLTYPEEPCCCENKNNNNDDKRTDDWQTSGELLGCTCCKLPSRLSLSTEPSEYTNPVLSSSVVPVNDYYDAGQLENNKFERNSNWQNLGESFSNKCPGKLTPAAGPSAVTHEPTCPYYGSSEDPCCCDLRKDDGDESTSYVHQSYESFVWRYSDERRSVTGTSALTLVPKNPNNIPPEEPCYCENKNNNNGDERTDVLQTSGELLGCSCRLSHVSLVKCNRPDRLGHDIHYQPPTYKNKECLCQPYSLASRVADCTPSTDDAKSSRPCHVPLDSSYHPDRLGHDMHYFPTDLESRHKDECPKCPCQPFVKLTPNESRTTPAKSDILSWCLTDPRPAQYADKQELIDCSYKKTTRGSELTPNQSCGDSLTQTDLKNKSLCAKKSIILEFEANHDINLIAQKDCDRIGPSQSQACLQLHKSKVFDSKQHCFGQNKCEDLNDNNIKENNIQGTCNTIDKIATSPTGSDTRQLAQIAKEASPVLHYSAYSPTCLFTIPKFDKLIHDTEGQKDAFFAKNPNTLVGKKKCPCQIYNDLHKHTNNVEVKRENIKTRRKLTKLFSIVTKLFQKALKLKKEAECGVQTMPNPQPHPNSNLEKMSQPQQVPQRRRTYGLENVPQPQQVPQLQQVPQRHPSSNLENMSQSQQVPQRRPTYDLENVPQPQQVPQRRPTYGLENVPQPQQVPQPHLSSNLENMSQLQQVPQRRPTYDLENVPQPQQVPQRHPSSNLENMSQLQQVPQRRPTYDLENMPQPQQVPQPDPSSNLENMYQPQQVPQRRPTYGLENVPQPQQVPQPDPSSNLENMYQPQQVPQRRPTYGLENVPQPQQVPQPDPSSNLENMSQLQQVPQRRPTYDLENVPQPQQVPQRHPSSNLENMSQLQQVPQRRPTYDLENMPQPQQVPQPDPSSNLENMYQPQQVPQRRPTYGLENVPQPQQVPQPDPSSNLENMYQPQQVPQRRPTYGLENVPQPQQVPQPDPSSNLENMPQPQQVPQPDPSSNLENMYQPQQVPQRRPTYGLENVPQPQQVPQLQQVPQPHPSSNLENVPEPQQQPSTSDTEEAIASSLPPVNPNFPHIIIDAGGYPYQHDCGWLDKKKLMKFKSDLCAITSGFKMCKIGTWIDPEPFMELSFEDAVKYYAGKNLDQFRDLLPPRESELDIYKGEKGKKLLKKKRAKEQKMKKKEMKKARKMKNDGKTENTLPDFEEVKIKCPEYNPCECRDICALPPVPIPKEEATTSENYTTEELEQLYPKGMKLRLIGKGPLYAPAQL